VKVLLLHKFLHVTGGAEVYLFETARALQEAGHEVAFMATSDAQNVASEWEPYFTKPPDFRSPSALHRAASLGSIVYNRVSRDATSRLLEAFRPDVAHAFNVFTHLSPSVLDACGTARVPVLMTCNDYKHICPNYKLSHHGHVCEACADGHFFHAVRYRCCQDSLVFSAASALEATAHRATGVVRRNVHTFLFSSDFMRRATERFWGVDSFRWRMLRNPFDSPGVPAPDPSGDYALFIGRFSEEKGADLLVRAAALVPRIPVVLVGDGPEEAKLRALAGSLATGNVSFAGARWGGELDELIDHARFVVVPSLWQENYPYVVVQSIARGKPVVGSSRGGIPEMVHHGETGVLFDPESAEMLAAALDSMWADPAACRVMGRAAKEYADATFNREAFARELSEAYRGVMG
jgi:glycosyltransferase involved in cell wall biosynthesis